MINDPIAAAEAAQRALDELYELTGCAEPNCIEPATPDGPAFVFGRNQDGAEVRLRKWRCAGGHWYHLEIAS